MPKTGLGSCPCGPDTVQRQPGLQIAPFPKNLSLLQVTNATLKVVTGLTKLESLTLGFTRVLNAGVAHLSRMTALTELHFFAEDVSDVALQVGWPALSSLQTLITCWASTGTSLCIHSA